jgi:hypothetical protein
MVHNAIVPTEPDASLHHSLARVKTIEFLDYYLPDRLPVEPAKTQDRVDAIVKLGAKEGLRSPVIGR